MTRETAEELQARMREANCMVPQGRVIQNVWTGRKYMVRGHALRVGDLRHPEEVLVTYSPLTGPVVVFCRTVADIRARFVLTDGAAWEID